MENAATRAEGSHRPLAREGSAALRHQSVVFAGLAAQIVLQFVLSVVLARLFGASLQVDAYRAAFTLPAGASAVLTGALGPVIIAILARSETGLDKRTFTGAVLSAAAAASVLLAVAGWLAADELMAALLPDYGPAETALTADLFRVLVWLIPANTLIGLFQSLLNASLVFAVPAVAGIAGPLLTVAIVVAVGDAHGMYAIAIATVAGAILNAAIQLPKVLRQAAIPGTLAAWKPPPGMARLAGPVLFAMLILKIDPVVDRYVSSYLPTGSISRLDWSYQIVTIFVVLASGTLSTVAFPRIAGKAVTGGAPLDEEIGRALRALVTLCAPAVAALMVFAGPLVRDLFERGQFTASDTAIVATLVRIYAVLLIGAALGELCTKTMYALRDSATPTAIGSAALAAGFLAKLAIVPQGGVWTLPLISSMVYLVGGSCLLVVVRRRTSRHIFRGLGSHLQRCVVATLVALGGGGVILASGVVGGGILGLAAGAVCYFAVLALLDADTRAAFTAWRERR